MKRKKPCAISEEQLNSVIKSVLYGLNIPKSQHDEYMGVVAEAIIEKASKAKTSSLSYRILIGEGKRVLINYMQNERKAQCPPFESIKAKPEIDYLETYELLEANWHRLTKRQRQVVALRYGMKTGIERNYSEIAEILGLSKQRVRTILICSMQKLRSDDV